MSKESNNLICLINELVGPLLKIVLFFKNIFKHIFHLFYFSWKSSLSGLSKEIIQISFISVFFILSVFNIYYLFVDLVDSSLLKEIFFNLVIVLSICSIGWGFSAISSVKQNLLLSNNISLKEHFSFGFSYIRFFISYSFLIVALISFVIIICLIGGSIPYAGQTFLSLFLSPVFFAGLILFLTIISLFVGSIFYGPYFYSSYFNTSLTFLRQTISLYKMVSFKLLDLISIIFPALLSALTLAFVPFLITMIILTDIIHKPTAGLFDDGIAFPGLNIILNKDEQSKQRSFNFLKSKDFHNRPPSEFVVNMKQKLINQTVYEYNENEDEFLRSLKVIDAIKSLGFSSPGRQLDSLDSFIDNYPDTLSYEGVQINNLRFAIENEIFQDLIRLDLKLIQNYFVKKFTHFDESWSFDSSNRLTLVSIDDFMGEKIIIKNDSVLYFESSFEKDSMDSKSMKLTYASKIDEDLKYVGKSDHFIFTFLTDLFLVFSDAIILAFPLMFMFASLASISFDIFVNRLESTSVVKFSSILLILFLVILIIQSTI